jgi:hypothetical protein
MATDPEAGHAAGAKPPTALARRYVQYVVGFGIAVGIGLSPFLGKIAGVDALLNLFPPPLRASLIPVSAFLMGLIAVAIQFYSSETLRPTVIRKRFGVSWLCLLAGLLLLFFLYGQFVVAVPSKGGKEVVPVVIGAVRIQGGSCGCPPTAGTIECIQRLSVDPGAIETCWDAASIRFRSQLLSLSYLLVTGGFGALIGLLLLQEEAKKKQQRRPRKAA